MKPSVYRVHDPIENFKVKLCLREVGAAVTIEILRCLMFTLSFRRNSPMSDLMQICFLWNITSLGKRRYMAQGYFVIFVLKLLLSGFTTF